MAMHCHICHAPLEVDKTACPRCGEMYPTYPAFFSSRFRAVLIGSLMALVLCIFLVNTLIPSLFSIVSAPSPTANAPVGLLSGG